MLTKEVKEQIKDMGKDQLLQGMRDGSIKISKEDREDFFQFVAKTPEERAADIQGVSVTPPAAPADVDSSKDGQGSEPDKIADQGVGGKPSEDPWAEFGYKSPTEFTEAHKGLLKQVANLSATIDGLNAKGGKVGQELKRLREEREDLLKKINASSPNLESLKPTKPVRPKREDFEDGILDDRYQSAMIEYEIARDKYTEDMIEYNARKSKEEVTAAVDTKIKDVAPQVVEDNDGYSDMFNNEIPKFQEKFNLKTTVAIKDISDAYIATGSTDPIKAARARDFIAKVPPADLQKYELVSEAVNLAYDFTSNKAVKKYRTIEGALYDAGKLGENSPYNPVIKKAALTPEEERAAIEQKQREKDSTVSAIPASKAAVNDPNLSSAMTFEEKQKRYKELTTDYNKVINSKSGKEAFEKSPQFEEWVKLRSELFGQKPYWR